MQTTSRLAQRAPARAPGALLVAHRSPRCRLISVAATIQVGDMLPAFELLDDQSKVVKSQVRDLCMRPETAAKQD